MKYRAPSLFSLAFAAITISATPDDPVGFDFFEKHIRPLLVEHCHECHSAESPSLKGGLQLDHRQGWLTGGDSGPAIEPGRPDQSRLIRAVRYGDPELQMPPRSRLADAEIRLLEQWVARGAPDPRQVSPARTVAPETRPRAGKEFWSFQPLAEANPPQVEGRVSGPVDAFILDRLKKAGVSPAPPADKRTLLRRATWDLTGLPPSPAESAAFIADDSTNAFEKVVDRLLASPQYGVRWGRHWLDVARYADSNGLDENLAHGNAWRYRDYVIESFNRDKPFDRFIIEQIAGDLVPGADRESKTATGFLALGAKVLAEPDMDKLVMDVIDEQIDTVGKAFLGMSLGCARCHEHKFDPFSQEDYYGLAAIFKSTLSFADGGRGSIKYWYEHDFSTEEERARMKEIDKQISEKKKAASSFKSKEIVRLRGEARQRATDYLMAATRFGAGASLEEVSKVAVPLGLHARILHHCRLHLDYHRDDPFFADWHRSGGDTNAIARHYGVLFTEAEQAFADARKKDPKASGLKDPRLEAARAALHDLSGFLAVPSIPAHAFAPGPLAEYEALEEEARRFESAAPDLPSAMGVTDGQIQVDIPLHIRGSHVNLGRPIRREFPELLRYSKVRPILPRNQSGRLQLADWVADSRNPLTARVIVNRVWRWHFGRGLVGTTENFGLLGDRPSHPALLDWLAREFMESGWRLKPLHKLIMLSGTYQRACRTPGETSADPDPENRLWGYFDVRRLEAEEIRDGLLAVTGLLDLSLGGKTIPLRNRQFFFNHTSEDHTGYDERLRRAAYLPVVRNHLCDLFQQFDYPDPSTPTGNRFTTVVAPQALFMMNSPLVLKAADALAEQLLGSEGGDAVRIGQAYRRVLLREPSRPEIDRASSFLRDAMGRPPLIDAATIDQEEADKNRRQTWSLFCQSLLVSNEFLHLN